MGNVIIKLRRGKSSTMNGTKKATVLQAGEAFLEYPDNGIGTGASKLKVGDGKTQYSNLPYALGEYAEKIKDDGNNHDITIAYSKSGLGSTSWLAGWNDYELRAISPDNITTGNAKKLASARNIAVSGDLSGSANFDGSANISINTTVNSIGNKQLKFYKASKPDNKGYNSYLLMYDVTTWYNSTTQGIAKTGFIGTVITQRNGGYLIDHIGTIQALCAYQKVNADDGSSLMLRSSVGQKWYPVILLSNSKYYLALKMVGGGSRDLFFLGFSLGTWVGTWINATDANNTLPSGVSVVIDGNKNLNYNSITVEHANSANYLQASRSIKLTGDTTGSATFNGSSDSSITTTTSSVAHTNGRPSTANTMFGDGKLRYMLATSSMTSGKPPWDSTMLHLAWDSTGKWDTQIAQSDTTGQLAVRAENGGTWSTWNKIYDEGHKPSKSDVGLGNVDNTADSNKLVKGLIDGATMDAGDEG